GAGDLDGDGFAEIVTGAATGTDVVGVYRGGAQVAGLTPFGAFPGGAFVSAGDRDGDGDTELLVGAGPGAGPHVKVYTFPELTEVASFFAFAPSSTGGATVASAADARVSAT
ncbi:MAG: VCBS repeat-containing protein, partial [Planctomycetes bacterium]|nr:VCBS repeat-containing protein [Planctomycetota bacterium]